MKQSISKYVYDAMVQRWKEIIEMNFATQEDADLFLSNFEIEEDTQEHGREV